MRGDRNERNILVRRVIVGEEQQLSPKAQSQAPARSDKINNPNHFAHLWTELLTQWSVQKEWGGGYWDVTPDLWSVGFGPVN